MFNIAFLINLLLALLFGWLAFWIALNVNIPRPPAILIGVIVGLLVFLSNLAGRM